MSRPVRDLPIGFDTADAVIACIDQFPPKHRLSRLADLVAPCPAHNQKLTAYAAALISATPLRNVSLYRSLCQASQTPVDEAWCAKQEAANNTDVLDVEKNIGRGAATHDRAVQVAELGNRVQFASEIGNVQDIHRFATKQQTLCQSPEDTVQAHLQAFDALLFAATWDERDTPTTHSIAQSATRADSAATKHLLAFKANRSGDRECQTEGAAFDLFAQARAAAILGRWLTNDFESATSLILEFPLRADKAFIGKLETLLRRWTSPERFAVGITLSVLACADRAGVQAAVNHPEFRVLLESDPRLLDAFNGVLSADFASVGKGIAYAESVARSDRMLRQRADMLGRQIRKNLIVQFVTPYKVLKLQAVCDTFQMPLDSVQRTVAELINKGSLAARIDIDSNLLYSTVSHKGVGADVHEAAIDTANAYVCDMHQALRMQSLQMHHLFVPQKKRELTDRGGGKGGRREGDMGDDDDMFGMYDDDDDFGSGGGGVMAMMLGGGGGGDRNRMRAPHAPYGGRSRPGAYRR